MADGSTYLDEAGAVPLSVIGFAGGGGSSAGYRKATGRGPTLAANHWLTAVLAHQRHFPATEHYCADIFDVDPLAWRPHEPIRFGWFSPDCTDHSKAKGGAPKSERIRGLGWSVIPWAKARKVQTIMVENVEEYVKWGPVYRCADDWRARGVAGEAGHPIDALRETTFRLWVRRLRQAGYWVEWAELVAADFGDPTTRKRFYCIAEYVGEERLTKIALGLEPSPITWPEPTHAPRHKAEKLGRRPWRGFCEVADWSQPCPSIFLTPAEVEQLRRETGRRVKRPLVPATLKRIARGLERYVLASSDPFIVPVTHPQDARIHDIRDPLPTVTAANRGELAMVAAGVAPITQRTWAGDRAHDVRDPLKTMTAAKGGEFALMGGALVRTNFHSSAATTGVRDPQEPVGTVTGDGGFGFAGAYLVPRYGERPGQEPRCLSVEDPLATVTPDANQGSLVSASLHQLNSRDVGADASAPLRTVAGRDHHAVQSAYLVRQFGSAVGGRSAEEPLRTLTAGGERGGGHDQFVAAYMAQGNFDRFGRSCCDPVTTLTGRATQQQLVAAHLDTYYGEGSVGSDLADPMRVATGRARHSLVTAWLEQANTGMVGHDARSPVSTIIAGGDSGWGGATQRLVQARLELDGGAVGRRGEVLAFLWQHFGLPTAEEWADPTGTLAARKKFGLVLLGGAVWMIVDIGLRMLTVPEMAAAQGLPADHDLSRDAHGRPISKTHQTQMIGNMVCPGPCAAMIQAQCPDLCPSEERKAA